jgi:hypothetical protein
LRDYILLNSLSDCTAGFTAKKEIPRSWFFVRFVDIFPFETAAGSTLKRQETVIIHDQAKRGLRTIASFSLPDNFHRGFLSNRI